MSAHGRFTARPEARYCAALATMQVARRCKKLRGTVPAHGPGHPLDRFPVSPCPCARGITVHTPGHPLDQYLVSPCPEHNHLGIHADRETMSKHNKQTVIERRTLN